MEAKGQAHGNILRKRCRKSAQAALQAAGVGLQHKSRASLQMCVTRAGGGHWPTAQTIICMHPICQAQVHCN